MKKKKWFWGILLLLLLLALAAPRFLWQEQATRSLPLLIVDKTVPDQSYREHAGLIWSLNHFKIQPPEGQSWRLDRDYLGFTPPPPGQAPPKQGPKLRAEDLKGKKWLFIADSYGVYRQDFRLAEQEAHDKELDSPDYSQKIYGGFDGDEISVIENFVAQGGHLWGEFNTFASPTHGQERERLEEVLGVEWSGWAGRYFEHLENTEEVPAWARRNWKRHHGSTWDFRGPGWMLVHEDSRIEVLQEGPDIAAKGLKIHLQNPHPLLKNCYDRVPFYYWFDILKPLKNTQVLAQYELELSDSGRQILNQAGIPAQFPALLMASEKPLRLYFAGDASDAKLDHGSYKLKGRMYWKSLGRLQETSIEQRAFFWEFYLPLIHNIIDRLSSTSPPSK